MRQRPGRCRPRKSDVGRSNHRGLARRGGCAHEVRRRRPARSRDPGLEPRYQGDEPGLERPRPVERALNGHSARGSSVHEGIYTFSSNQKAKILSSR